MTKAFLSALLIFSFAAHGQGRWKPFKLVVIMPDTAIVNPSYRAQEDTMEVYHLKQYYASIKQMEDLLNFKDYPPSMKKSFLKSDADIRKRLPIEKAKEQEVRKFKYFQAISEYSTEIYNYYFNEYKPFSTIIEIPHQKEDIKHIRQLAAKDKADYVIFFDNIHTDTTNGKTVLKLTTSLYESKSNKIILDIETEGDNHNEGGEWTCDISYPLNCFLINSIRTSVEAVFPILAKKQAKDKHYTL